MANRVTVYPGQGLADDDVLNAGKYLVTAIGHLAGAVYGEGVQAAEGFAVTPSGMKISVGPGSIYSPGSVDVTAFGSLPLDSTVTTQQYVSDSPTNYVVPGSGTFYVWATIGVVDDTAAVLPYYDAANPGFTISGPTGSLTKQATRRAALATIGFGTSAPGNTIPLWTIAIPAGATAITTAMISQTAGTPLQPTIPQIKLGRYLGAYPMPAGAAAYVPSSPFARFCEVLAQAPGASGGASPACSSSQAAAAGGGSAGGYVRFTVAASVLAACAFNIPGAAAPPNPGANNGNNAASLTATLNGQQVLNIPGGLGGLAGVAGSNTIGAGAGAQSLPNNVCTIGTILTESSGGGGMAGFALGAPGAFYGFGGAGGDSGMGKGGSPAAGNSAGVAGAFGAGGAGGCVAPGGGAQQGGWGGDGRIIVWEYT